MIVATGDTTKGKKRLTNQDAFYINDSDKLWIIADGMGGHAGGEKAANEVCEQLPVLLKQASSVIVALQKLHQLIVNTGVNNDLLLGMGATIVVAKQIQNQLSIYWIGDCRAYLVENNKLSPLTKDHSYVQKLVDLGLLNKRQARNHPKRNIVTQCIGGNKHDTPEIGATTIDVDTLSLVLLCSDGLYSELEEQDMHHIIKCASDQDVAIKNLLDAANAQGGNDNITAILLANDADKTTA